MPEDEKQKQKYIQQQIQQLINGVGATAELLGVIRKALMESGGFTRDEAVGMCTELLLAITVPNMNNGGNE